MPRIEEPCVTDLLKHKDLTSIAKDQQALLDKPSSWHTELRGEPAQLARIPTGVLEAIKSTYSNRKKHSTKTEAPPRQGAANGNSHDQDPSTASSPAKIASTNSLDSSPPPRSLPRLSMPISSVSPQPRSLPRSPIDGSSPSSLRGTPSPRNRGVEPAFQSQVSIVKETPNQHAGTATIRLPRLPNFTRTFDFPSSVAEEDMELEMVPPRPIEPHPEELHHGQSPAIQLSTAVSSLVTHSSTMNTPPCAQPDQRVAPTQESPEHQPNLPQLRGAKRMKPIDFGSTQEIFAGHKNGNTTSTFTRFAPTKDDSLMESSISTATSSVVPATLEERAESGANLSSARNVVDATPDKHTTQNDELPEVIAKYPAKLAPPQDIHIEPQPIPSSPPAKQPTQVDDQGDVEMTEDSNDGGMKSPVIQLYRKEPDVSDQESRRSLGPEFDLAPFDTFVWHYPEYTGYPHGTLWSFVRACFYLEILRERDMLRDCLWDEFIHAFARDYVGYAGSTRNATPALEWFNSLSGPTKFTDMVVSRNSLHHALTSYPDVVARAKLTVRGQAKDARRTPTTAEADDASKQASNRRTTSSRIEAGAKPSQAPNGQRSRSRMAEAAVKSGRGEADHSGFCRTTEAAAKPNGTTTGQNSRLRMTEAATEPDPATADEGAYSHLIDVDADADAELDLASTHRSTVSRMTNVGIEVSQDLANDSIRSRTAEADVESNRMSAPDSSRTRTREAAAEASKVPTDPTPLSRMGMDIELYRIPANGSANPGTTEAEIEPKQISADQSLHSHTIDAEVESVQTLASHSTSSRKASPIVGMAQMQLAPARLHDDATPRTSKGPSAPPSTAASGVSVRSARRSTSRGAGQPPRGTYYQRLKKLHGGKLPSSSDQPQKELKKKRRAAPTEDGGNVSKAGRKS